MLTEFKRDVCGNVLCLWIPQCRCVRSWKIGPMKEVYLFTWLNFTVSFVKDAMASSEVCRCAHCSCGQHYTINSFVPPVLGFNEMRTAICLQEQNHYHPFIIGCPKSVY